VPSRSVVSQVLDAQSAGASEPDSSRPAVIAVVSGCCSRLLVT